jgi:hypothetical protein
MFNKKFLIASAVALSITGANAIEKDGFDFSGGVNASYNYMGFSGDADSTDSTLGVDKVRVAVSKELSSKLSVYGQFDGGNLDDEFKALDSEFKALSLTFKANDKISIVVGKDYFGSYSFGDLTSTFSNAYNITTGFSDDYIYGDYIYGGALNLTLNNNLSISVSGGVAGDLAENTDRYDGVELVGSHLSSSLGKGENNTTYAIRLDYNINGLNVGAGYQFAKNKGDSKIEENKSSAFAADVSYAKGSTFAVLGYVNDKIDASGYDADDDDTLKGQAFNLTALTGLSGTGEFSNFGSLTKAKDFVYGGAKFVFEKNDDNTEKNTIIGGGLVLGYAPNTTIKFVAEGLYGTHNYDPKDGSGKIKINIIQAQFATKISF